jgi:hypothetical protein
MEGAGVCGGVRRQIASSDGATPKMKLTQLDSM